MADVAFIGLGIMGRGGAPGDRPEARRVAALSGVEAARAAASRPST